MLIHLESGSCACGVDLRDVDNVAFSADDRKRYTNAWDYPLKYRCPECDRDFGRVSALLQHVGSEACGAHAGLRCLVTLCDVLEEEVRMMVWVPREERGRDGL